MSRTADIEAEAARWVLRREEESFDEAGAAALEAWLREDAAHRVAFYRLEHGWQAADRIGALGVVPAQGRRQASRRAVWMRAAAAVLVVACVGGAIRFALPWLGGGETYATAVGGREIVPLADGSRVELNTDTRLHAEVTAQNRAVWLDQGEAYFEVAHDRRHPFVVYAGPRKVTVLGTKFSVRRNGDQVVVVVVEGRVRVDAVGAPKLAQILTRNDEAIAQGASTIVVPKSETHVAAALSWREGLVSFDRETLADVAAEFNRYNDKKLVVDPAIANMRIAGIFEAGNVDAFARLLQRAYGMKVADDGEKVRVSP